MKRFLSSLFLFFGGYCFAQPDPVPQQPAPQPGVFSNISFYQNILRSSGYSAGVVDGTGSSRYDPLVYPQPDRQIPVSFELNTPTLNIFTHIFSDHTNPYLHTVANNTVTLGGYQRLFLPTASEMYIFGRGVTGNTTPDFPDSSIVNFSNFVINQNVGGGLKLPVFQKDITIKISGTATFTDGRIYASGATEEMLFENFGVTSGGSPGSYYDGPMRKVGSFISGFKFILGDLGKFSPLTMDGLNPGNGTKIRFNAFSGTNITRVQTFSGGSLKVSDAGHYTVSSASTSATITIEAKNLLNASVNANSILTIVGYNPTLNGGQWVNLQSQGANPLTPAIYNVNGSGDPVLTIYNANLSNISQISVGSITMLLPIDFTSFSVIQRNDMNVLTWSCANAVNTSHFIVEKSCDGGRNFINAGEVKFTAGSSIFNFTEVASCAIKSIYRIKAVDKDGRYNYSNVRAVLRMEPHQLIVYYSHFAKILSVDSKSIISATPCTYQIFDGAGKRIKSGSFMASSGTRISLDMSRFAAGQYYISFSGDNINVVEKLIIY